MLGSNNQATISPRQAVINRDIELAKFLIGMGADVRARAIGTFFRHGGKAYFGEYPMSFAAALGHQEMVLLLHRHGASPRDRDAQGNTALHVAIYHGHEGPQQLDMYDFLGKSMPGSRAPAPAPALSDSYAADCVTEPAVAAQCSGRHQGRRIHRKRPGSHPAAEGGRPGQRGHVQPHRRPPQAGGLPVRQPDQLLASA